ncbi:Tetratricopeptide repeat-containing protein [Chitinophaga jiangningensis]|uniref:Tetratricopeptide repeat-containing protein n=1 Tax=Chitinophaga jiangningensis TaxID=1419482 RepID=A0A1M6YSV1_9BACT|nr:tetratricopeptide repeat protein [Chitinophaga jiangningensis]SHL21119.1 Tetratricopeptide repeat-containing protein [Chitinophaga jiangningensis]
MIQKPHVTNIANNEWAFIQPAAFSNEETLQQYTVAVGMLDTNDVYAELILKAIIKDHPYHLDAYNHLSVAFRNQEKAFESYLVAEKSYRLGRECFPKEFKIKNARLPYINSDNRPFLRACHIWGLELQFNEEYERAIEIFDEMLQLNPNDNQGARHLKLECLFVLKDFAAANQLLQSYPGESSIEFTYGKIFIAILAGDQKSAEQLLGDAVATNPYLPAEIVKKRHTPPPGFLDEEITVGSRHEAYEYWFDYADICMQQPVIEFFESMKPVWSKKKSK